MQNPQDPLYTPNTVTHHLFAYLRRPDDGGKGGFRDVDCQTTASLLHEADSGVESLDREERRIKFFHDYENLHWSESFVFLAVFVRILHSVCPCAPPCLICVDLRLSGKSMAAVTIVTISHFPKLKVYGMVNIAYGEHHGDCCPSC